LKCRYCDSPLEIILIDLGMAPLSNAFVGRDQLSKADEWRRLRVFVCSSCWLVQTEDVVDYADIFGEDYPYFSSYSSSWVRHAKEYVAHAQERFCLTSESLVIEVASNDGYLLEFVKKKGIQCYGIEPTQSTANVASRKGIKTINEFLSRALAVELHSTYGGADLVIANNVLAHVPNISDFLSAVQVLLNDDGVASFEVPHLSNLVRLNQFDTIYHEHFSYFSLTVLDKIFGSCGLSIFDVLQLSTHGGSLRIFAQKVEKGGQAVTCAVRAIIEEEGERGISTPKFYIGFQERAEKIKEEFNEFLRREKSKGASIVGYGAAAKANTLLNFAQADVSQIHYIVDQNPAKQGTYTPGSRIPVVTEDNLKRDKPDYIIIFPWNLRDEIQEYLAYTRSWGARLVVVFPELEIC
jgi:hypothetical protein